MLAVLNYAWNGVAPILCMVLLGYALKVKKFLSTDFFRKLNKFTFTVCFPPMLFANVYCLDSIKQVDLKLSVYVLVSCGILTLLGVIYAKLMTKDPRQKSIFVQSLFRSNYVIIGLTLAQGLGGTKGVLLATMVQGPVTIYYNAMSVIILSYYGDEKTGVDYKRIFTNIVRNPLIQGLALGMLILVIREYLPLNASGEIIFSIERDLPWVYAIINYLNRIASPLALIALGGLFEFSAAEHMKKQVISAVAGRILLAPLFGFSIAFVACKIGWISMTPPLTCVLIALYGSPLAVATVAMAAEMNGDETLAGQVVVWTSVLSMFTIFLMAAFFRSMGLL